MSARQGAAAALVVFSMTSALAASGAIAGALVLEPMRVRPTTIETKTARGGLPPPPPGTRVAVG